MAKPVPLRPKAPVPQKAGLSLAIVASKFNPTFIQSLVEKTSAEVYAMEPDAVLDLHTVPGAFEIPLAVKLLAAQKRHQAIIALGVLLQGETEQARIISQCVTEALQRLALSYEIPILNGVIFAATEAQAQARCQGDEINRGVEVARAAIKVIRALQGLRGPVA